LSAQADNRREAPGEDDFSRLFSADCSHPSLACGRWSAFARPSLQTRI